MALYLGVNEEMFLQLGLSLCAGSDTASDWPIQVKVTENSAPDSQAQGFIGLCLIVKVDSAPVG